MELKGNERVDSLANIVPVADDRAMGQADMLNAIKDSGKGRVASCILGPSNRTGCDTGYCEEKHTGLSRNLIDQHRTRTVNHCVLTDLQRKSLEPLCTYSTYCEDDSATNYFVIHSIA